MEFFSHLSLLAFFSKFPIKTPAYPEKSLMNAAHRQGRISGQCWLGAVPLDCPCAVVGSPAVNRSLMGYSLTGQLQPLATAFCSRGFALHRAKQGDNASDVWMLLPALAGWGWGTNPLGKAAMKSSELSFLHL